ncbi:hypothetical protein FNJ88_08400 [Chryseobacterium sp. SNU WT5]|uniref:hypothetical protein n=1 Tax=Chryseobacterium sp. SNU WT5 TaxID=2594269 RepID=UPI0011801684|nr:hypothetical protein [Chryseobacterium sp. SNU WT5]QDP85581.1 hypothetical protein FNJ88_08400 [Chryseobacterium sp. SNU WT5]
MKFKTLIPTALILMQVNCMAQSNTLSAPAPVKNTEKTDFLAAALEKAKASKSAADIQSSVNEIKRIESMDPNNWLPNYYISYLEIVQSFFTNPESKDALLEDAKKRADKLLENNAADKSEVYTLLGYYYYGKIAQDSQKNGQLYFKEVIGNYQKAIALNSKNPRPNYLLNLFEEKMNAFMGNKDSNICEKLNQSKELFANFKPVNKNDPNWGEKDLLTNLESKCSKK